MKHIRTTVRLCWEISILSLEHITQSPSQRIIQMQGEAFSGMIKAMQGSDIPPLSRDEIIANMEHDLMIEGHQFTCEKCRLLGRSRLEIIRDSLL